MEALQREIGRIIPSVFPHLDLEAPHAGERTGTFDGPGSPRAAGWASPGSSGTTSGEPRSGAWRSAGVPRSVAMKITGHKTESVYRRYALVDAAASDEGLA